MSLTHSFKFVDEDLNRRFLARVKKTRINHRVDKRGVVHYSPGDDELVESSLLEPIRNEVFSAWQVLSCPADWTERYRQYMARRAIPFEEELANDQVCFLLPREYRPHAWKLS